MSISPEKPLSFPASPIGLFLMCNRKKKRRSHKSGKFPPWLRAAQWHPNANRFSVQFPIHKKVEIRRFARPGQILGAQADKHAREPDVGGVIVG